VAGAAGGTSGEYLETIFTHRELLLANPAAHRACAEGFHGLALCLDARAGHWAWRPQHDADGEAAAAYRSEAKALERWVTGGWLV
jgi:hypothetical protein